MPKKNISEFNFNSNRVLSESKNLLSGFNGKTVLVTGHTGFKGSWLSFWLKQLGANVVGISLPPNTNPSLFNILNLSHEVNDLRVDIRDSKEISRLFTKIQPNYVFHLAAQSLVGVAYRNPIETWNTNVIGTLNVMEALKNIENYVTAVIITSDKCYRNIEQDAGYIETDELGGSDPYSASKGAAEMVIRSQVQSFFSGSENHIRIASARAGNVIAGGDWAGSRLVPDCVRSWSEDKLVELRDPNSTRPWQHVLEPLSGYLNLALSLDNSPELHGEAFNFGPNPESNYTVSELVEEMALNWNRAKWIPRPNSKDNYHESKLLKLDCEKAFKFLNWNPVLKFSETAKLTIDWYKTFYSDPNSIIEETKNQIDIYERFAKNRGLKWAQ